jgi:hypothetical protein
MSLRDASQWPPDDVLVTWASFLFLDSLITQGKGHPRLKASWNGSTKRLSVVGAPGIEPGTSRV